MAAAAGAKPKRKTKYVALGGSATVYAWNNGFGAKYAAPATYPYGATGFNSVYKHVSFSPDGTRIGYCGNTAPMMFYHWSEAGFGALVNYSVNVQGQWYCSFSPDNTKFVTSHNSTMGFMVWDISSTAFTGYKQVFSSGVQYEHAWVPDSNLVIVFWGQYNRLHAFSIGATAAATTSAFQSTLLTFGYSIAVSPSGKAVAVGQSASLIRAIPFNKTTGFGTALYTPSSGGGSGGAYGLDFHPDGNAIAVCYEGTPYVSAYPWSDTTGFGTKYSNPTTPITTNYGADVAFGPSGDVVFVSTYTSPYIHAYAWSPSGFGVKYANPSVLPTTWADHISVA